MTNLKKRSVHYTEGQKIKGEFSIEKQLTTPPKPVSEGTLLAKMEKYSLGTPATRAEMIEKLIKSDLMERKANYLAVTPIGKTATGVW